jgi:hypothetical protein
MMINLTAISDGDDRRQGYLHEVDWDVGKSCSSHPKPHRLD